MIFNAPLGINSRIIFISKKNWLLYSQVGMLIISSTDHFLSNFTPFYEGPSTVIPNTTPPPMPRWLERRKISHPSWANDSWAWNRCSRIRGHCWGAASSLWASGGHFPPLQGGAGTGKAGPNGFLNLASRPPQGLATLSLAPTRHRVLSINSPLVFA